MNLRTAAARTVSLFCVPLVLLAVPPMAQQHCTQNATHQLVAGLDGLSMPNRTPVESLLKRGADANARNAWGDTVLHLAAYRAPQSVAALLDHGADPNAFNADGATPLMTAVTGGNPATVRFLLSRGADANVRQRGRRDGMTALGWARNAVQLARKVRDPHAARYPVIVRALQEAGGTE